MEIKNIKIKKPRSGRPPAARKSYRSFTRFFLLHLPVFEIRTNYPIHYIFSTLSFLLPPSSPSAAAPPASRCRHPACRARLPAAAARMGAAPRSRPPWSTGVRGRCSAAPARLRGSATAGAGEEGGDRQFFLKKC